MDTRRERAQGRAGGRGWGRRARPRRGERGQVLMISGLLMAVLLGATGLAIDVGVARVRRRDIQNAADAAALAGADDLPDLPASTAIADATCQAAQDGNVDQQGNFNYNCQSQSQGGGGMPGVTVSVASPPVHSASHNGDPDSVEVTITRKVPTAFLRIFGIGSITVRAHAVATATGLSCALCVLDAHNSQALFANNAATLDVRGGGILVNSDAADAVLMKDSAQITAPSAGVTGCTQLHDTATITPPAVCGVAPVADPLASLPVPSVSGALQSASVSKTQTIQPGVYSSISVTGNGNLTLAPGTYVITGQFAVHDSGSVTGNGVTLYFACPAYPTPCAPGETDGGNLYINDAASFTLAAPTTGPQAGVAIFYDRNNAAPLVSRDASNPTITGTIYARSSLAMFADRGTAQLQSLVVVGMFSVQDGTRGVHITYSKGQNSAVTVAGSASLTE